MFKRLFNIKVAYGVFFLSIVFWSFFAYYTMNQLILSQEIYANIINLSGKQRMLSQKTTLISKRVYESNDFLLEEHLRELIDTMKSDHAFIIKHLTTENLNNIYFQKPCGLNERKS